MTGPRICETTKHCPHCGEPILSEESARLINGGAALMHAECLIRVVAGSVAHQLRRCSCFGGTEEDPPGATRRQAAKEAESLFAAITGTRVRSATRTED